MANKGHRQGVNVKTYTDIKIALNDLNGLKAQYRYFRDKKQKIKDNLIETGQYSNAPQEVRYEMCACRVMLGILEVQITKVTSNVKKLQKEESHRQVMEKIKEQKKREREYRKRFQGPTVTDENGIKYYVTEEHRKEIMSKIQNVANQINEKGRKGGK